MLHARKTMAMLALTLAVGGGTLFPAPTYAASGDDIDAQIQQQQELLKKLNAQKDRQESDRLASQIADLKNQLKDLRSRDNYDAQGAIEALSLQIQKLERQQAEETENRKKLTAAIDRMNELLEKGTKTDSATASYFSTERHPYVGPSSKYLVNPGPQTKVSYTQDAKNSQGNSTMVFQYAPNQLYKIYCRTGYLTDMTFHAGEKIQFVGGGDTSSWAINSTTVDGVPHLYIKPTVPSSTTNLIVTTNKRSYQIIVTTSSWYNPMVRWEYEGEELLQNMLQDQKDERDFKTHTDATSTSRLNFNYKVKVKGDSSAYKPTVVFDDGSKTVIQFPETLGRLPAVFIKEKGHKSVSLVNFKQKDDCLIIDRLIDKAELRFTDTDIVTIDRKKG